MSDAGKEDDYMLKGVPAMDYILSGIFVLIISVLVSFLFAKRIKLDMIEVLKGRVIRQSNLCRKSYPYPAPAP